MSGLYELLDERRKNAKTLMKAIESCQLDFHTTLLATIDLCKSTLYFIWQTLSEQEQNEMRDRLHKASVKITEVLNNDLQSPGEVMFLLLDSLEQAVVFSAQTSAEAVQNVAGTEENNT